MLPLVHVCTHVCTHRQVIFNVAELSESGTDVALHMEAITRYGLEKQVWIGNADSALNLQY